MRMGSFGGRNFMGRDTAKIAFSAENLAKLARVEILKMTSYAKASHVGSALSVVDILSVLYVGGSNITPVNFDSVDRDIVLLSKGHAASALYSVLALQNFFPLSHLKNYCSNGALLGGHVTSSGLNGVELSTGSLGHGLPYGAGIALSRKRYMVEGKVFVVMSDGECDEGTTWESALLANHHNLNNLTVIIDRNRIQSLKDTESTLKLEPFKDKWEAFGWKVMMVDGHNYIALISAIEEDSDSPKIIIANTTKGSGVSFMENSVLWHYRSPNDAELDLAIREILGQK
jgi:transketolase